MKFRACWVFTALFLAGFGSPSGAAPGRQEEAWLEELAAGHQLSALQMQATPCSNYLRQAGSQG